MDLSIVTNIVLLVLAGVVAALGIVDRRSAGKSKNAEISLLKERITKLKEEQTPEAVYSLWKAKINLAEGATDFATEKMSRMDEKSKKEIEDLLGQISFLKENVKVLSGTISAGTKASTNISGSALYQDYSKSYTIKAEPGKYNLDFRSNDS